MDELNSDVPHKKHPGRRPGTGSTRQDILQAAAGLFSRQGFEKTSVRSIAAEAGVDPALVRHYFGDKEALFINAVTDQVNIPERMAAALEGEASALGERLVQTYLSAWEDEPESRTMMLALMKSAATSENAAAILAGIFTGKIKDSGLLERREDMGLRLGLAASHMLGLGFARYVLKMPLLAGQSREDLVRLLAPVIQNYFTPAE